MKRDVTLLLLFLYAVLAFSNDKRHVSSHEQTPRSTEKRQFRGAWIATVANIDWPSHKAMPADSQMMEMRTTLDSLRATGVNAVLFQARPCADALYRSDKEPWSAFLSGKQGTPPDSLPYDPLDSLITLAHDRCMEAHVWLNPYRAAMTDKVNTLDSTHPYFQHPEWFLSFGGRLYFNPGIDSVRDYLLDIVSDIVTRYDLDALVFDDYFYPYPIPQKEFPDLPTYKENPRGFSTLADWRRDNVNMTIAAVSEKVRQLKPWVQFGISPFGVWRHQADDTRGSNTVKALTNYDDLYADVLYWIDNDLLDYVSPQLYWEKGHRLASYDILLPWWCQNKGSANLYISLYASGFSQNKRISAWQTPNEIARQLTTNRQDSTRADVSGEIFYSTKYFLRNEQGLLDSLRNDFYRDVALTPFSKLAIRDKRMEAVFRTKQPHNVTIHQIERDEQPDSVVITWDAVEEEGGKAPLYYVVYAFEGHKYVGDTSTGQNIIALTRQPTVDITEFCQDKHGRYSFVVTTFNRYRLESLPASCETVRLR